MTDDDDQPATAAAGNDETTVVPPPTETAPPLAYSDEPEGEEAGSWREASDPQRFRCSSPQSCYSYPWLASGCG